MMKRGIGKATVSLVTAIGIFGLVASPSPVEARPQYFETLKSFYSIGDGDQLDACGVCHFQWEGTGQRNPFGTAVEQQLYLGKSITQSLMDVETDDTDGDGFTNVDEITVHETLPGYDCNNYFLAVDPPLDYHTFITPGVATCLVPLDIRIGDNFFGSFVAVGESETHEIEIFNNGSDFAVDVTSLDFTGGSSTDYAITGGPTAPFSIPVGGMEIVEVTYTPSGVGSDSGSVQIDSNDPDEPSLFVSFSSLGFEKVVAPAEERAACFETVARGMEKYTKAHLKEWNRCYLAEVNGQACDTGARDAKILKAEAKFRSRVGGDKDTTCDGLSAALLDLPETCAGNCSSIALGTIESYADCMLCQQDEVMISELTAAVGSAPPDLPSNTLTDPVAQNCQKKVLTAASKTINSVLKLIGRCEVENVTAVSPVDCIATNQVKIDKAKAKVDGILAKCQSTTDMLGCSFDAMPDPACLSTMADDAAQSIVDMMVGDTD